MLIRFSRPLSVLLAAVLSFSPLVGWSKASSQRRGAPVHVKGYTKKDGTYVAPHYRSAPNGAKADNWSTKGNVNLYTGKEGTKNIGAKAQLSASPTPVPSGATPQVTASTPPPFSAIATGAASADVLEIAGEPSIKTATKWYYTNRGCITFVDGKVLSVAQW